MRDVNLRIRTVRPTLLDLRFAGDPWILGSPDGTFAVCVGNFALARIDGLPLDLPSLNQLLDRVRHRRRNRH